MITLKDIGGLAPVKGEIPDEKGGLNLYRCKHCGREQKVPIVNGEPVYPVSCYGVDCPNSNYNGTGKNYDIIGKEYETDSNIIYHVVMVLSDDYCLCLLMPLLEFTIMPIKIVRQEREYRS